MPFALMLVLLFAALPARAAAPLDAAIFELEHGPFYVLNNDGTYGRRGRQFEAKDVDQQNNLFTTARISLELRPWQRHGIVLLWAPLPIETRTRLARPIQFRDTLFAAGEVVDSRYVFDGYRGTYLFRALEGDFEWDIGAAVQIRNATVSLAAVDGSGYAERSDIGFVPALATRLRFWPSPAYWLQLDATGLSTFGATGGTEGSLYDVALSLGLPLDQRDDASLFVRTRLYGGGVELEDGSLMNQAAFLFLTAGVRADLVGLIERL